MRILYLSCHEILEYDEVKLFHELGYEVFSPGAYVEPKNPGNASLRPEIPGLVYNTEILNQWHQLTAKYPGQDAKDYLTKEFVDNFDIVIIMHLPRWIENNWNAIKHKRIIWRTIGQSISSVENQLRKYRNEGLQIVRYSPKEITIPGYIGEDALIRFYKDENEFGPWNGNINRVITFAQHMKERNQACNFSLFEEVTKSFPRHLFGPGNEGYDFSTGKISYQQQKEELKNNRVYFYTGTHPASYTLNFIESWISGIPIVAIGSKYGNASYFPGHNLYEIPELIEHCSTGLISDSKEELKLFIKHLMENKKDAQVLSEQGRLEAIKHFGKQHIKESWRNFIAR